MSKENILSIYRLASPEEIEHGVTWYAKAYCESLAISEACTIPVAIVVGVVAALSPNNKWDRNIRDASRLCEAFVNGDPIDSFSVSTYGKMKQKAWRIIEVCQDVLSDFNDESMLFDIIKDILNGQKITCFFENIMGVNTCTVDGHAYNIYHNQRQSLTGSISIGKKEYATIQEAYKEAGEAVEVNGKALKAYEMQAITWVVWRRLHKIK